MTEEEIAKVGGAILKRDRGRGVSVEDAVSYAKIAIEALDKHRAEKILSDPMRDRRAELPGLEGALHRR